LDVAAARRYSLYLLYWCKRANTDATRGGAQYLAILSQPPGSIRGSLRVTIQGEVIESYFGTKPSCELTMERYTRAALVSAYQN
jgi:phosphoenolpyruvate carboxylase